jgi:hypothetical protein
MNWFLLFGVILSIPVLFILAPLFLLALLIYSCGQIVIMIMRINIVEWIKTIDEVRK